MIDYLLAALFGAVQGITEILPVSSSGHLVFFHEIWPNFAASDQLGFDVALHAGTLIALIVFFRNDIINLIGSTVSYLRNDRTEKTIYNSRITWLIIVSTIPAAVIGFFFESDIEKIFRSMVWVGIMLILGGLVFLLIEITAETSRDLSGLTISHALIIGMAQVLAFIPGVSRSGSTIAAGRALKLSHYQAARFSFLLSLPIVFGASIKKIFDLTKEGLPNSEWNVIIIGFVFSAFVGISALRFLLKLFQNHSLRGFAYYRIVLGLTVLVVFLIF
ncbi:MAG: undecaprenyl-diphosphate phosphatase [bacterium]